MAKMPPLQAFVLAFLMVFTLLVGVAPRAVSQANVGMVDCLRVASYPDFALPGTYPNNGPAMVYARPGGDYSQRVVRVTAKDCGTGQGQNGGFPATVKELHFIYYQPGAITSKTFALTWDADHSFSHAAHYVAGDVDPHGWNVSVKTTDKVTELIFTAGRSPIDSELLDSDFTTAGIAQAQDFTIAFTTANGKTGNTIPIQVIAYINNGPIVPLTPFVSTCNADQSNGYRCLAAGDAPQGQMPSLQINLDGGAPAIAPTGHVVEDVDQNGHMDRLEMMFTKRLDPATFDPKAFELGNGYNVTGGYLTDVSATASKATLFLQERPFYDTGAVITFNFTPKNPFCTSHDEPLCGIRDLAGNVLLPTASNCRQVQPAKSCPRGIDGAAPLMVGAWGRVGSDKLDIFFSEPVSLSGLSYLDDGSSDTTCNHVTGNAQVGTFNVVDDGTNVTSIPGIGWHWRATTLPDPASPGHNYLLGDCDVNPLSGDAWGVPPGGAGATDSSGHPLVHITVPAGDTFLNKTWRNGGVERRADGFLHHITYPLVQQVDMDVSHDVLRIQFNGPVRSPNLEPTPPCPTRPRGYQCDTPVTLGDFDVASASGNGQGPQGFLRILFARADSDTVLLQTDHPARPTDVDNTPSYLKVHKQFTDQPTAIGVEGTGITGDGPVGASAFVPQLDPDRYYGWDEDPTGAAIQDNAAIVDVTEPTVVDARTVDSNHNGFIDGIQLTFSEPVNDASFCGQQDFQPDFCPDALLGSSAPLFHDPWSPNKDSAETRSRKVWQGGDRGGFRWDTGAMENDNEGILQLVETSTLGGAAIVRTRDFETFYGQAAFGHENQRIVSGSLADAVTTIGSTTVSSRNATFSADDVGRTISGSNLPTDATIVGISSPTDVVISKPATGTGSKGSLRIADIDAFNNTKLPSGVIPHLTFDVPGLFTDMANPPNDVPTYCQPVGPNEFPFAAGSTANVGGPDPCDRSAVKANIIPMHDGAPPVIWKASTVDTPVFDEAHHRAGDNATVLPNGNCPDGYFLQVSGSTKTCGPGPLQYGDGTIDGYHLVFSEPVVDGTFCRADWQVEGYEPASGIHDVTGMRTLDPFDPHPKSAADDGRLTLQFNQSVRLVGQPTQTVDNGTTTYHATLALDASGHTIPVPDTDARPQLTYAPAACGLRDHSGNAMLAIDAPSLTEQDGAAPVLVKVGGFLGQDYLVAKFSEPVDDGNHGALTRDDFNYYDIDRQGVTGKSSTKEVCHGDGLNVIPPPGCAPQASLDTAIIPLSGPLTASDMANDRVAAVVGTKVIRETAPTVPPAQRQVVPNDQVPITLGDDVTPPGAVSGFRVDDAQTDAGSVTLAWIAPGDDGQGGGPVYGYDVRVANGTTFLPSQIASIQNPLGVGFVFSPVQMADANHTQTVLVTGLQPDTQYSFAVRAVDEAGNPGPPSNVVAAHTTRDHTPPVCLDSSGGAVGCPFAVSSKDCPTGKPVARTSCTFSWPAARDDESPRSLVYRYKVSLDPLDHVIATDPFTTGTSVAVNVGGNGTHYFHVAAFSGGGATATAHYSFLLGAASLAEDTMAQANDLVQTQPVRLIRDGLYVNVVSWTLPDLDSLAQTAPGAIVVGVELWRQDGASVFNRVNVTLGTYDQVKSGNWTDLGGTADSKYRVDMVFAGSPTQAQATPTSGYTALEDQTGPTTPLWVWTLIGIGLALLVAGIVIFFVLRQKQREEGSKVAYAWESTNPDAIGIDEATGLPVHEVRCPSCNNPFQAIGNLPLPVTCPNCGTTGTLD